MEVYNKIKSLLEIEKIAKMRGEQLRREHEIDLHLKKCTTQCPAEVINYLFNMRELNRWHSEQIRNKTIFNYAEQMKMAYNEIENIQKEFQNNKDVCTDILPKINSLVVYFLKRNGSKN